MTAAARLVIRLPNFWKTTAVLVLLSALQQNASVVVAVRTLRAAELDSDADRTLIVDRDAIKALEEQGIDSSHPEFYLHPPGHQANVDEYPFFAYWEGNGCAATVVHDDILLTAAHCLEDVPDPHIIKQVRLLSKYRDERATGITRSIAHWEPHPDYRSHARGSHDFLLIKLNASVLVDENGSPTGAQVVQLNKVRSNPSAGDPLFAAGFGYLTPTATRGSPILMDVQLEALSNTLCAAHHGLHEFKEDVMLCVGTQDGSRDTCSGDSGGAILDQHKVQVGIVSWGGTECAHPDQAGVAARIDKVVPWIENQICRLSAKPPSSCKPIYTTSYNHRLRDLERQIETKEQKITMGVFDLKVTVDHDDFSFETSWSFTHVNSFQLLHWQPYQSDTQANSIVHRIFSNLEAGTYYFAISDANKDGICCSRDSHGGISIINEETGSVLWQHSGEFHDYVAVTLELDGAGSVVSLQESTKWNNPTATDEDKQ